MENSSLCWWHWRRYISDYVIIILVQTLSFFSKNLFSHHHRAVIENDPSLAFPLSDNIISSSEVLLVALVFPLLIFFCISYVWKRDYHDLHHATLGLLQAYCFTSLITRLTKMYCGRARPNHWSVIDPNEPDSWSSFPSGHASIAAAGCTILTQYLAANLKVFDPNKGESWRFILCFSPMLGAFFIGCSRTRDVRFEKKNYFVHWGGGVFFLNFNFVF